MPALTGPTARLRLPTVVERYDAEPWLAARDSLGESPRYDERSHAVRWIDIDAGERRRATLGATTFTSQAFGAPLGAHELGVRADAVAVGGGWFEINRADGHCHRIADLGHPGMRFNDSGIDSWGRLWSATMREDEVTTGEPAGTLQLLAEGSLVTKLEGLTAGNGLAWTPEGDFLFLVDSGPDRLLRIPFDPVAAALGTPEVWLESAGAIDGITIDSAGGVWAAVWGAGELRRYDAGGSLTAVVRVGADQVTSACFTGPHLRTLVISTAARDDPSEMAGSLFRVNVPIPGRPNQLWRGC